MSESELAPSTTARQSERAPSEPARKPLALLLGNPNTGKTTLFNRLTGQSARIGNYPGITVERRSGELRLNRAGAPSAVEVVDVPGAYSLSARSAEEQIALASALGLAEYPRPDLCVVVVDAGQLARNLYLVLQLLELDLRVVVALNMIDEVRDNPPSESALARFLGVPCVATVARRGQGISALEETIAAALASPERAGLHLRYPEALERDLLEVERALPPAWATSPARKRALALWALTSIEADDELEQIEPELRECCLGLRARADARDIDQEVIATRYALIDAEIPKLYPRIEAHPPKRKASERVDRVLLHPVFGFVIFVALMLIMFQSLFSWSDPAIRLIEAGTTGVARLVEAHAPEGLLRDLITRGVIGGVGNVVVFLPQILLLFFCIGLLEDSGYMARVAFLMDRVMKALGLHGRAFVPMLSGFACAVPAILATRTMERQRDRLLTMLVVPLMTCSARLPVYTLIIAALFPPSRVFGFVPVQGLLMIAMYLFSTAITLIAAGVLGRTAVKGRRIPLILELPPYRLPSLRGTLKMMLQRASSFLREAGTGILLFTVLLWGLLSFPRPTNQPEIAAPAAAAIHQRVTSDAETIPSAANASSDVANGRPTAIEQSYGGRLGKALEPALRPLGFDWKIGVGLIGAFAAREVFVSTLGLVYGIGDAKEDDAPLRDKIRAERRLDGAHAYTPLMGLSLMVFFALSCQCMSTLSVVYRETKSFRWPLFMFTYMTSLAYVASLLVYQGGRLLGFL
ncbi:MAG TPA: ferrous iron transport protein B [Polyangiaceae bacterium]|nr:ferrous iron transport protein B [Polyangiaceae bacterium]